MPQVNTYIEQAEYFADNRRRMLACYRAEHDRHVALYGEILSRSSGTRLRDAVALALLLRAAGYTNTAHNILLEGHVEEARIILRSPVELALLAFLVKESDDVWNLWQECHDLRLQHTDPTGMVKVPAFSDSQFNVNRIIKAYGGVCSSVSLFADLKRLRGEFSTYWAHENLYNIVPRVERADGTVTLYVGNDADSENDRMKHMFSVTARLMQAINELSMMVTNDTVSGPDNGIQTDAAPRRR